MATAISEQIAVKVKTRLGLINTDSGYETTTTGVIRATRQGDFQPKDYQIIVTQGTITRNEELSHPGNPPATAYDMPFQIAGVLRPSDDNATAADTLKNQFWGDCVKALTTGTAWYNWDGLAINTAPPTDVEDYQAEDGAAVGFRFILTVTFRTDENDPFTARA